MAAIKLPKNLAIAADDYKKARDARLKAEKVAAKLKETESALYDHILNNLPKSKAGGISGKLARVEIVTRPVPIFDPEDEKAKDKFFAHAHKKGNEDLVDERMNAKAVAARWEDGKTIPGIIKYNMKKLSLHAVAKKR